MPLSQLLGAFHGFSSYSACSALAHPAAIAKVNIAKVSSSALENCFIGPNLVYDLIAFKDVVLLPFRHDIRDRTIRLDARDLHFCHKSAVAVHQHFRSGN